MLLEGEIPKVSVVVPNFNGLKFLDDCFTSLSELDYRNYEVIMVDNASMDGSVEYVQERFPWVQIVRLHANTGFAMGSDIGIERASSDFVALLNNDVEVDTLWLAELVKVMLTDKNIASCGSKMLFYDRREIINHAGAMLDYSGGGYDRGFGDPDGIKYNKINVTGCTSGGAMLVRKEIFCKLGGFDADYFAYFEDVDFGLRAWEFGYKMMYVPSSIVYHKFGGSFGNKTSNARIYYCQKNRLTNIIKHFEPKNVIRAFVISIAYDIYRMTKFVLVNRFGNLQALIKGSLDFLKNLNTNVKKRSYIQQNRRLSDSQLKELGIVASIRDMIHEHRRVEKLKNLSCEP